MSFEPSFVSLFQFVDINKYIDNLKKQGSLSDAFFKNESFFKELLNQNILKDSHIQHVLNQITQGHELYNFCRYCPTFVSYCLENWLLTSQHISNFNHLIKSSRIFKRRKVKDFFQLIQLKHHSNLHIIQYNELNKFVYSLRKFDNFCLSEKIELAQLLKRSKIAQDSLSFITVNNLESIFKSSIDLKSYLIRSQFRKNLLNI